MATKLNLTYPSITATKAILKMNPDISADQVKGYDRRARAQPFIMEHVKIIEGYTIQCCLQEKLISEMEGRDKEQKELIKLMSEENQVLKDGAEEDERANAELTEKNEKLSENHITLSLRMCDTMAELERENEKLTEELDEWKTEIQPDFTELRSPSEISSMIDDMYENIKELTQENEKLQEQLKKEEKGWADQRVSQRKLRKSYDTLEEQLKKEEKVGRSRKKAYEDMVRKLQEQLKKGGEAHMKDKKAYDTNLKIRDEEIEELVAKLEVADYYQSGVLERLAPLLPLDDSPQDIIGDICDIIKGD